MSLSTPVSIHPLLPLVFPPLQAGSTTDDINTEAAWHFYSHNIQRNPNDLKSHTRRIFLAMQHSEAKFLPGCLSDLFIILKNAGIKLKIRLLKASAPYLDKQEIIRFAKWIKADTDKEYRYAWAPGSMLTDGLLESNKVLFTKEESIAPENKLSAIEEAQSCMEYGQLDLAKKILEEALEQDKNNQAIKDELSNLLQYTNANKE